MTNSLHFNPTLVPVHDAAKTVFDVLYQTHPEYQDKSTEWHEIRTNDYSPSIRTSIEIIIPEVPRARFLITKQDKKTDPILIDQDGKFIQFEDTHALTHEGKQFKQIVLTIGKQGLKNGSRINIDPEDKSPEKDLLAIFYIPPQISKENISVEESITIYNITAHKVMFRFLFGNKKQIIPIIIQLSSYWRVQKRTNKDKPAEQPKLQKKQQETDFIQHKETPVFQTSQHLSESVISDLLKHIKDQSISFNAQQNNLIKDYTRLIEKNQSLQTELLTNKIETLQHENVQINETINKIYQELQLSQRSSGYSYSEELKKAKEEITTLKAEISTLKTLQANLKEQLNNEKEHTKRYQENFETSHKTIQEGIKTESQLTQITEKLAEKQKKPINPPINRPTLLTESKISRIN